MLINLDGIQYNKEGLPICFHPSNMILLSSEERRYDNVWTIVSSVSYVFDCEQKLLTRSNKVGLADGRSFVFSSKPDNFIFSSHYYEATFGNYSYRNTYMVKNGVLYDSLNQMDFYSSFDKNEAYCLFGKDSTLIYSDFKNKSGKVTKTMPFVFRNYVYRSLQ